jgi:hypothetical protein
MGFDPVGCDPALGRYCGTHDRYGHRIDEVEFGEDITGCTLGVLPASGAAGG